MKNSCFFKESILASNLFFFSSSKRKTRICFAIQARMLIWVFILANDELFQLLTFLEFWTKLFNQFTAIDCSHFTSHAQRISVKTFVSLGCFLHQAKVHDFTALPEPWIEQLSIGNMVQWIKAFVKMYLISESSISGPDSAEKSRNPVQWKKGTSGTKVK